MESFQNIDRDIEMPSPSIENFTIMRFSPRLENVLQNQEKSLSAVI